MAGDKGLTSTQGHGVHLPPLGGGTGYQSFNVYSRDCGYRAPEGDVDFVTNYRREYSRYKTPPPAAHQLSFRRQKPVPNSVGLTPSAAANCVPYGVSSVRHGNNSLYADDVEPLQSTTVYRDTFVRHSVTPSHRAGWQQVAGSRMETPRRGEEILNEISNSPRDFTRKDIIKLARYKPSREVTTLGLSYDEPFDSTTTHRTNFQRWRTDRPTGRTWETYGQPEGVAESVTTPRLNYGGKAGSRRRQRKLSREVAMAAGLVDAQGSYRSPRPDDRSRPSKQPHYRSDYVSHVTSGRDRLDESGRHLWTSPDRSFDGRTAYRDQFVRHQLPERPKYEQATWEPSDIEFDDVTIYRKDFTGRELSSTRQKTSRPGSRLYQTPAASNGTIAQPDDDHRQLPDDDKSCLKSDEPPAADVKDTKTGTVELVAAVASTEQETKPVESSPATGTAVVESSAAQPDATPAPPLEAPRFHGHRNYGFEYEKWAGKEAEKRVPAAM